MNQVLTKIESLVEKVEDWTRLPEHPLVSVFMTTYNHEKFIAQALDGVLMQEVDFPYEIVVGEDCSTDRTREIICEYQQKHPDKIRLRLARENLYSQKLKPGFGVLHACRGQYIAMCEGDDYWTDPLKLQKQVAFLESNPDYAMCFHYADNLFPSGRRAPFDSVYEKDDYDGFDILNRWLIPTASMVFRRSAIVPMPDIMLRNFPHGDLLLQMLLAEKGKIRVLHEVMSVYRQHEGGVMNTHFGTPAYFDGYIAQLEAMNEYFSQKYRLPLHAKLQQAYYQMISNRVYRNRRHLTYLFFKFLGVDYRVTWRNRKKVLKCLAKYFMDFARVGTISNNR